MYLQSVLFMIETVLAMSLHSISSMGGLEKYVLQCDPVAILVIMSSYIYFASLLIFRVSGTLLHTSLLVLIVFWIAIL